jgi:hypothetical protein
VCENHFITRHAQADYSVKRLAVSCAAKGVERDVYRLLLQDDLLTMSCGQVRAFSMSNPVVLIGIIGRTTLAFGATYAFAHQPLPDVQPR